MAFKIVFKNEMMRNKKARITLIFILGTFIFINIAYSFPQEIKYSLRNPLSFGNGDGERQRQVLAEMVRQDLAEISRNLWFEWNYKVKELFRSMDPELWESGDVDENPDLFSKRLENAKLEALTQDSGFMGRYQEVADSFKNYMDSERSTWVSENHPELKDKLICYTSLEFGVGESTQSLQSGGLGALSGDHVKQMSDMGFSFIGVGLAYKYGYGVQVIDADGKQNTVYSEDEFLAMPKEEVRGADGKSLRLEIPMYDSTVKVKVWKIKVGRGELYLLDTDIEENAEWIRDITKQLYPGEERRKGKIHFHQAFVLGVGQAMLLDKLGVKPNLYHLNESHAGLAIIGMIKNTMDKEKLSFEEALAAIYHKTLFTTHTPIAAGNWTFHKGELEFAFSQYFEKYLIRKIISLGVRDNASGAFNLAQFLLNVCGQRNGVSEEHGQVSREQWSGYAIGDVLNGVSIPYWQSPETQELLDRKKEEARASGLGQKDERDVLNKAIDNISYEELRVSHLESKKRLVSYVRKAMKKQWTRIREDGLTALAMKRQEALQKTDKAKIEKEIGELEQKIAYADQKIKGSDELFDENALTIVIARRFAEYKRSNWLLSGDFERIRNLLKKAEESGNPVQIIFAGKAHPTDGIGKRIIMQIHDDIARLEKAGIKNRVIFLENYSLDMAHYLVQGADVWLSYPETTPIPKEASATSGEKASLDGVVNAGLTTGFMRKHLKHRENAILFNNITDFYGDLEGFIIPEYYPQDVKKGYKPSLAWMSLMRESMRVGVLQFGADRMLVDYTERYYANGVSSSDAMDKDDYALSKRIAGLLQKPDELVKEIDFGTVDATGAAQPRVLKLGGTINPVKITADVQMGEFPPEAFAVSLMFKLRNSSDGTYQSVRMKRIEKTPEDMWRYEGWIAPLLGGFKVHSGDSLVRDFRIDEEHDLKLEVRVRPIIYFGKPFTWPEKRKEIGMLKILPNTAEPEKLAKPIRPGLESDARTAL